MDLMHVIYTSIFKEGLSSDALENILEASRKNNEENGITGVLIYSDGLFMQLIEGRRDKIESLIEKIKHDHRHYSLSIVVKEEIFQRSFPDWSMAFVREELEDLGKVIGMEGYLDLEDFNKKLLQAKGWPPLFLKHYSSKPE
ncbi:MAG: BLUF domain-containing protein [Magnetococcales bacterium]|nr:BLUF domain-containing protein [Magnetococcales bacterium]